MRSELTTYVPDNAYSCCVLRVLPLQASYYKIWRTTRPGRSAVVSSASRRRKRFVLSMSHIGELAMAELIPFHGQLDTHIVVSMPTAVAYNDDPFNSPVGGRNTNLTLARTIRIFRPRNAKYVTVSPE